MLKQSDSFDQGFSPLSPADLKILFALDSYKPGHWVPLAELQLLVPQQIESLTLSRLHNSGWISTREAPVSDQSAVRLTVKGRHKLQKLPGQTSADSSSKFSWPATSNTHYFTGKTALNIPSATGTGDWHMIETFEGGFGREPGPFFIAGSNYADSSPVFGTDRIYDAGPTLRKFGIDAPEHVFAADHFRAMADMLLYWISQHKSVAHYQADEWFPAAEDKTELQSVLIQLYPILDKTGENILKQWIRENLNNDGSNG